MQAKIVVGDPPRAPVLGPWAPGEFYCQSLRGTFSWGTSPACAVAVYVGAAPVVVGALVKIHLGNHFFAGVCVSDTACDGSRGGLRTLEFADLRRFLAYDHVAGCFNKPFRQMVAGKWVKRYEHVYPADHGNRIRTFTDRPLRGWQIVNAILSAPTVGSPWQWDLTGNGLFPQGLLNGPVFDLDFMTGVRLDSILAQICDKCGVVLGLDSRPNAPYRLVFMRKGYGLLPVFPDNADDRRIGISLSGNATNIRVLGERNRYQILDMPMQPDWAAAWEQFIEVDNLADDLFNNEKDPGTGLQYKNFPDDPEFWKGSFTAKIRALNITVGEYVRLRNARKAGEGDAFADYRKFAQRSRMDMPAALYLQTILFRAFRPAVNYITNVNGVQIPLNSVNIVQEMPCRVTYDPVSGAMEDDPTDPADGNGVAIVKGYQFGEDFFQLVKPERITPAFFNTPASWSATTFQVDDSGEGERFIIFDQPVFCQDEAYPLFVQINGQARLNANYRLVTPQVRCALTFEAEQFSLWRGTYPNVSLDQVEYVGGLQQEFTGRAGAYREVIYANGESAVEQARAIADDKLLCQYVYISGGYNLKWKPSVPVSSFGTALGSLVDRVEIELGTNGVMQPVDWTTERQRDNFEPERDLDRKTMANSLFPGQAELRQRSYDNQRLLAGIKAMPRELFSKFMSFLQGDFGQDTEAVRFDPSAGNPFPAGSIIAAGSVIFKSPTVSTTGAAATGTLAIFPANYDPQKHLEFAGVTVRDGENASKPFLVQKTGDVPVLVQGPVRVNDRLGAPTVPGGAKYTTGAYFNTLVKGGETLAVALQAIPNNAVKLINVRLATGTSTDGEPVWLP